MTHLVKAESLAARVPREGAQKGIQLLGSVSKASEVFPEDNDYIWAHFLRLVDQLQFTQALRERVNKLLRHVG